MDGVVPAGARKLIREAEEMAMKRNISVISLATDGGTTDESTCCSERERDTVREEYFDLNDDNASLSNKDGFVSQDGGDDDSSHFGFFDEFFDVGVVEGTSKEAQDERDAWTNYSASLLAAKSSSSQMVMEEELDVLFNYNFPNPSQCFKLSNSECNSAMELSCVVSGFRIAQRISTGEISAHYGFVFCYGSRSHFSWRRYSEFRELAGVLQYTRDHFSSELFRNSLKIWSFIEYKKKLFRDLSVLYLVRKAMHLNKFMESVMFESPNPALLLHFAQSSQFVAL